MSDATAISYETGWDSSDPPAVALTAIVYCWWLVIGGVFEILGGGIYFGTAEQAAFHASTPELDLAYVLLGIVMVSLGFGILRLERWVYWAAWLMTFGIAALSIVEIVRRVDGTSISTETVFFAGLNVLFVLYNVYFLSQKGTREMCHFGFLKGSPFSPGIALCGIVLVTPALAVTLYVNHINKNLSNPDLVLVYLGAFILMIVMAFMALRLQRWVWWVSWAWAIVLTGLSIDVIVRQFTAAHVDVEGIIFSAVNFIVVLTVVYYLIVDEVREAVFQGRPKQALFSPPTLIAGALLAGFALVFYLLPEDLGRLPITYSVFGMVMGVVVGLLPGADPTNRLMGFVLGLLLAFASFVVRGGLLPYTNLSAAIVVTGMLLVITGITALFRSRAWFVSMLLGAGAIYALAEPLFQAAPSGYLGAAGLAFVGILLGFGAGYMVSSLLELELVSRGAASGALAAASTSPAGISPSGAGERTSRTKAGPAKKTSAAHAGGSKGGLAPVSARVTDRSASETDDDEKREAANVGSRTRTRSGDGGHAGTEGGTAK